MPVACLPVTAALLPVRSDEFDRIFVQKINCGSATNHLHQFSSSAASTWRLCEAEHMHNFAFCMNEYEQNK